MSALLERVRLLVGRGEYLLSLHGFRELAADDISSDEKVAGIETAVALEGYSDTGRGPSVLILQMDQGQNPVHVVWGCTKGHKFARGFDYRIQARS